MKYKNFNLYILIILGLMIIFTVFFNAASDPFAIFNTPLINKFNKFKPDIRKQERVTKIIEMKFTPKNIDSVFVGASPVDAGIDSDYYVKITGEKAKNIAFVGPDIIELSSYIKTAIILHPEIKTIFLGLDFFAFKDYKRDKANFNKFTYITLTELAQVLLSAGAIESSFNTLKLNFQYNASSKVEKETRFKFETILGAYINGEGYYKNYKISSAKLNELRKLKNLCDQKQIKLVIFINPLHVAQLQAIKIAGAWYEFKKWKKDLSKITDFYDFSGFNNLYEETISPRIKNFDDPIHYTPIVGNKIIDKLTGNSSNLGIYITKNNIDDYNKKLDLDYNKWEIKNKELILYINSMKK